MTIELTFEKLYLGRAVSFNRCDVVKMFKSQLALELSSERWAQFWKDCSVLKGELSSERRAHFCAHFWLHQLTKNWGVWDAGVSYNITGTRFLYYISFSTIWWFRRNGTLLVQIKPNNGFETEKLKSGYRNGSLLPPPTSRSHYYRGYRQWLRADFWVMMFAT